MINKYKSAIFAKLQTRDALVLLIYAIIVAIMATRNMGQYIAPLTIGLSVVCLFYNKSLALSVVIISSPLMAIFSSGFLQIFVFAPFILYSVFVGVSQNKRVGLGALLISIFIVSISYLGGYEPDTITFLLQMNCMLMCYATYNIFKKEEIPLVIWSYICTAIMVIIYISLEGIDNLATNGRLNWGENSKALALICSIPLIVMMLSLMTRKPLFENRQTILFLLLQIVIIPLLLMVILATGARGILIGISIGILFLFFTQRAGYKKYIILCLLLIMAYQIFNYIVDLDLFRMERFFAYEEYSSGNGRTEIWGHYFKKMADMGFGIIMIGTGPGNISRISNIDYYAHSTFLDYFFSYGLLGFLGLCFFEFKSLKYMYHKENMIPLLIVITLVFCNMTHGSAANTSFFMLQSLMMTCFKKEKLHHKIDKKL